MLIDMRINLEVFGEDGDAEDVVHKLLEEEGSGLGEWASQAAFLLNEYKDAFDTLQADMKHKQSLWKCGNPGCEMVFEAQHNRCPHCYGP